VADHDVEAELVGPPPTAAPLIRFWPH
jgi:hypothetical protein